MDSWEQRGCEERVQTRMTVAEKARVIFKGMISPDINDLKVCDDPFVPDDVTTKLLDSVFATSRNKIHECIDHFNELNSKVKKRKAPSQDN